MKQFHQHGGLQLPVEYAHVYDDTLVSVEVGIKRQRLQRFLARGFRRRNASDNRFQNVVDPNPLFRTCQNRRRSGNRQNVLQLLPGQSDIGVRQINLVDDRDNLQVLLHRQVQVGDGLGLDTLRGIDDEQGALARAQTARDFVGKVNVTGRINQVQLVGLAVPGLVQHRDRMRFDGDAAFAFQVHRIEQLLLHLAVRNGPGPVQQAIRERRLSVINVGDDAEITYVRCVHDSNAECYPRNAE